MDYWCQKHTGQVFDDDIFPLVWDWTEGQPWLVNALGGLLFVAAGWHAIFWLLVGVGRRGGWI